VTPWVKIQEFLFGSNALPKQLDALTIRWMHSIRSGRRMASPEQNFYTAVATGIVPHVAVGVVSTGLANTVDLVVSQVVH